MYASLKIYRVLLDVGGFVCAASIHPSAGGHHIKVCPEQTQLRHLSSSLGADQRREDEGSANLHKLTIEGMRKLFFPMPSLCSQIHNLSYFMYELHIEIGLRLDNMYHVCK